MKRVLCFGDSNTWGFIPGLEPPWRRYPENVRWTGQLQALVGSDITIIEEGLNGRTTALDEPERPGRNGLSYLIPCLNSHYPLDLVILMLGTNDFKKSFNFSNQPADIAERMGTLIQVIKTQGLAYIGGVPQVLVLSPAYPKLPYIYEIFQYPELESNAHALAKYYQKVAEVYGVHFLDIAPQITASEVDGAHLEPEQHGKLAKLVKEKISQIFK